MRHRKSKSERLGEIVFGIILFASAVAVAAGTARVDSDLNSDWKFIRQDINGAEASTFDDSQWSPVRLPHTWNNMDGQDGGNDYYRGVGWYRCHLKVDQLQVGKSFFLKFDAASTVADVFVNGAHVGSHRGAFAAFCFDVTPLLHAGEDNVIAVKVNNAPDGDIAPLSGDFTVFGGLYRGAHLLVLDKLSITPLDDASSGVYITQTNVSASSAELEIRTKLRNAYDSARIPTVRCTITDQDGKTVRTTTAKQKLDAHGTADVAQRVTIPRPHLWNGRADPYLYNVTIEVRDGRRVTDTVIESLGLRYFSVDPDKGFFLNGRPYALHGANRHQERLDEGWAISRADQDEDFGLITEMGSTGVRLAHYQHAPYFFDLCDRGGIVVWAELCVVNEIGKSEGFRDVTRQQLTELIKQNYNHPSIMFWSLFNELRFKDMNDAVTESWCQLISDLNRLAKTLDPSRLTTAAWCCAPETHKAASIPDVIALNEYHGWYGGKPEDWPRRLDQIRRSLPGRRIAFSEYGAGASIQQHEINPRMPKANLSSWHPEEWQCVVHEQAWKAFKGRPWLWGTFLWNMFDFAADQRNEGDRPGQNDKGLVTHDRKVRKDAFYWYKANWTDTPFVHITSQRYTNRTEATTSVKVYSNCESVELRVNGESKGSLRSNDRIFLWTGVTLREGDNRIEAIGRNAGTDCRDSCAWTFTPPVAPEKEVVRFPHPDRIRYDGQCMTIDGKDVLIYSGAFHYMRCPQPLWRDRFRKIKEAGFNVVDTYIPWNWYERDKPSGPGDFSKFDFSDLKAWLEMAHEEFGLYTIIRPGPYICAEWDGGGFPRWLLALKPAQPKRPVWLRSDDPVYLAWSKHWFDAVCPVIAAEQVTRKPKGQAGVILFQIENEYDLYKDVPEEARVNHLRALYDCAVGNEIDVPIFTCWTKQCRRSNDGRLHNVFDGSNMYPRWNMKAVEDRLHALRLAQPDAPINVLELQGGWFAQVGHQLSEDQEGMDATQINHLTLLNLQEGTTILNYYMLFGGSNFGDWASRDQLSTYDYFAPIREPGGVGDKYLAVKAIGLMLREHGASLARSKLIPCQAEASNNDLTLVMRRGALSNTFVFCRNASRTKSLRGSAIMKSTEGDVLRFDYDLAPGGFRILYLPAGVTDAAAGEWLPRPVDAPERPAVIPVAVRIKTALKRFAEGGSDWVPVEPGESLPEKGVYDSRFVLYRSKFQLTPAQLDNFRYLALDLFTSDKVVLLVNGNLLVPSEPLVNVGEALRAGDNEVLALYENRGQSNFGPSMADLSGIRSALLSSRAGLSTPLETWRVKLLPEGGGKREAAPEYDDSGWDSFVLDDQTIAEFASLDQPGALGPKSPAARILFGKNATAVFRTRFDLPEEMIQAGRTRLVFDSIEDFSTVYVNGMEAGKTTDGKQSLTVNVATQLKPGLNVIAAVVSNRVGNGGLTGGVRVMGGQLEGVALKWELARQLTGVAENWWRGDIAKTGWSKVDLDTAKTIARKGKDAPSGTPEALATWYRMGFELPEPSADVWVPWRLLLDCSGNGFIYLNGHALGRYWDVGPQREYYLPECWLNFGAAKTNVLVLCLRPTEKGALLRAAEVSPYADYAERRQPAVVLTPRPSETPRINGKQAVSDLWRQTDLGAFDEKFEASVPAHGIVLVKVRPSL